MLGLLKSALPRVEGEIFCCPEVLYWLCLAVYAGLARVVLHSEEEVVYCPEGFLWLCLVLNAELARVVLLSEEEVVYCPETLHWLYLALNAGLSRAILQWVVCCPEVLYWLWQALTLGLLELYQTVKERLRPTPVHAHYIFSLHDVARVVQGILLMSPRSRIRKMRTKKKAEREEASKCGVCVRRYWSLLLQVMRRTAVVTTAFPPPASVVWFW